MPRATQPDHFEPTRVELGHFDGSFVAFAAGVEQQRLSQWLRNDLRERSRKLHGTARDHSREKMQRRVAAFLDGSDDVRMAVPDGCAHLAGREVQYLLARGIPHVAATGLVDDLRIDIPTVANQ